MTVSFSYSPWILALAVVIAAGLTYWTYRDTTPSLPPLQRWLLSGLRFGALTLLLILLFEPVSQRVQELERPPVLAVLVDATESLRVTAAGTTPEADDAAASGSESNAAQAVRTALDGLRDAGVDGETQVFSFGTSLRRLGDTGIPAADSIRFDGARTDIAGALSALQNEMNDTNLKGVVLVSDGQYNTGRNPLYVSERYPVPIHTVTVGDTTRQRDVQIRRIATNDIAYSGTELPVQVGLRADDAGGETVTVSLVKDGETLSSTDVRLPPGTAEVPVDLSYTPEETGLQRLVARVSRLDGEATYRNNEQPVTVRVLERKRRVLLLAAAPSPSFAAVRRILSRDADTEIVSRVPKQGGGFYEGPLPDDLTDFDVLVLAGFPSRTVSSATIERVASALDEGRPALFLIDRQTDLGAWDRFFADALPVTLEQRRDRFSEGVFVPAPERQQHPVYQIDGATIEDFRRLPPLAMNESRFAATPDARVLATPEVRGTPLNDPVLVVRRRAGQRTAAFLATGTWRWANLPEDLQAAAPLWPGLLSNLIRWTAARGDDRPVRVRPVESTFAGGERVSFTGQVYDESLTAIEDARVNVTVTGPDGAEYPYTMDPVGSGRYVLDVGVLPEGTYTYAAEATRDGTSFGTDRGQFSVGALTLEFKETRANLALMRQIAQRSGGTTATGDDTGTLARTVNASEQFVASVLEETRETEWFRLFWFLVAILALLATEWTLRKRLGLV